MPVLISQYVSDDVASAADDGVGLAFAEEDVGED